MAAVADEAQAERARLLQTLTAVGPDAPTTVSSWTAAAIASHLAAQDRLGGWPAFAARSFVRATGFRLSAVYVDGPRLTLLVQGRQKPWEDSLELLRRPIPSAVLRSRVAPITLWEHFVHHEDVRRPNNVPRAEWPNLDEPLDWIVGYNRGQLGGAVQVERTGDLTRLALLGGVTISGATPEIVLWLSGRSSSLETIEGPADRLEQLSRLLRV